MAYSNRASAGPVAASSCNCTTVGVSCCNSNILSYLKHCDAASLTGIWLILYSARLRRRKEDVAIARPPTSVQKRYITRSCPARPRSEMLHHVLVPSKPAFKRLHHVVMPGTPAQWTYDDRLPHLPHMFRTFPHMLWNVGFRRALRRHALRPHRRGLCGGD